MNKLCRTDLGLDVEAYKDYVNNVKIFAKHNEEFQILAEENLDPISPTLQGPLSTMSGNQLGSRYNEDEVEVRTIRARVAAKNK